MERLFRNLSALIITLFLALPALSETVRVKRLHAVSLGGTAQPTAFQAGISDGICISLPEDMTFVTGIEIDLKIPEEIAAKKEFVFYSLIDGVKQVPTERRTDYSGERLTDDAIPPAFTQIIYIPLSQDFSIKESPYSSIVQEAPSAERGFVFLQFHPNAEKKAEAKKLEGALMDVSVKPVLMDKGFLALRFAHPGKQEKDFSLFIDDAKSPAQKAPKIMLDSGEHHLSVVSDFYRNEVRTFRIEQGKTTEVTVALRGIEPTVQVVCPDSAKILFDNRPIENTKKEFAVAPGEHVVKVTVGDYDVIKSISAEKGRSYIVTVTLDATVKEY